MITIITKSPRKSGRFIDLNARNEIFGESPPTRPTEPLCRVFVIGLEDYFDVKNGMIRYMKVGITLTSSLSVGQEYIDLTRRVAERLANEKMGVVYGGTDYGMMSELAKAYKDTGGADLTGVMAKDLMAVTKGYAAFEGLDKAYLEETMDDRKHRIVFESDAFIILPGGYGTFEEVSEIIGGKVNKLYDKPIAIFNYSGFYDTLIKFLNEIHQKDFSKIPLGELVFISSDLNDIVDHLKNYQVKELADKFV